MPPRKRAESKAKQQCKLICCTTPEAAVEKIREDIARWEPGKWAEENAYGAACRCGLKQNPVRTGHGIDDGRCPRHG